jgi:hypothetical protein
VTPGVISQHAKRLREVGDLIVPHMKVGCDGVRQNQRRVSFRSIQPIGDFASVTGDERACLGHGLSLSLLAGSRTYASLYPKKLLRSEDVCRKCKHTVAVQAS